jgi:hypothetical protein
MYFDATLKDVGKIREPMKVEFGRSTFHEGVPLIYLNVNGHCVLMDEATGREFCQSVAPLANYLGYELD